MVSSNPAQGVYLFEADENMGGLALPGLGGNETVAFQEGSKKVRKPYTITKSRESWTDQEHDKFLEALHLFDRDWKKIEAFVGSKTVIQIRSHAQKYFLKVQKSGTNEHVPPPRPKRKAAHPYPQKAPKFAAIGPPMAASFQSSTSLERGYIYQPDLSTALTNPVNGSSSSFWTFNTVSPFYISPIIQDDAAFAMPTVAHNCCSSSNTESPSRTQKTTKVVDHGRPCRVMPDFVKVYSFLGSLFDPNSSNHLEKLKQMDPIDMETVLLLMRNLSINLTSPEFENYQRKLLASYEGDVETEKSGSRRFSNLVAFSSGSPILATG